MGRGTGLVKYRGRGEGMGAEDRDTWAERVRSGAANQVGVNKQRPPGHGGSGCGVARGPVRRRVEHAR
jgi:hypothetical protein